MFVIVNGDEKKETEERKRGPSPVAAAGADGHRFDMGPANVGQELPRYFFISLVLSFVCVPSVKRAEAKKRRKEKRTNNTYEKRASLSKSWCERAFYW